MAFRNNILWTIVIVVVPIVLGLALAVLLDRSSRVAPFLRTLFYVPAVLPLVSVAAIWAWMYNPTDGSVNAILEAVGLGSLQQGWLGQDFDGVLGHPHRGDLGAHRFSDADLPGCTAGDPRGTL